MMSWTRQQKPNIPFRLLTAQHKLNRALSPPTHDITVADPALIPRLPADLHTLHKVARVTEILGRDVQSLVTSETERHIVEGEKRR